MKLIRLELIISGTLFLWVLISSNTCNKKNIQNFSEPTVKRAVFQDPSNSPYILPFPVDKRYILSQTYCYVDGGHRNQLAYDFALPVGADVISSRSGVVMEMRQDLNDSGSSPNPGDHNHVFIKHADGSVAFYAHLKQNSLIVQNGDTVKMGQKIASSGNSGNTGNFPHLHFGVYQDWPAQEGFDAPVTFKNLEVPLDSLGGLIADQWYKALPY